MKVRRIRLRSNVGRLVKQLHDVVTTNGSMDISNTSGVPSGTIRSWFRGVQPTLGNFEAVAEAHGYELKLVKKGERS